MSRLPFDPDRVRGGGGPEKPAGSKDAPLTVSQVAELINQALVDALPRKVRVIGEVSNLSRRGHWYFSLKDEGAVLKCVAWASKAARFGFDARDGLSVVAAGSIQHYGPQGQTQLYVDSLSPVGAGALELRFRALCDELRALGYFDVERKKPVPHFPRRVAIITSGKGAALQDVLDTMARRCKAVEILIVDVRVQGAAAAGEIAAALRHLARHHARLRLDAVLLTRGGGSIEDLWAFNERVVADALFDFPIPTVAAIGHETDTTIAELVADLRCATPTQAAMRLAPDSRELLVQTDLTSRRLSTHLQHRLRFARQQCATLASRLPRPGEIIRQARRNLHAVRQSLDQAANAILLRRTSRVHRLALRLGPLRPDRVLLERVRWVSMAELRLHASAHERLTSVAAQVDRAHATLRSLDPRRVLNRGYSITRLADGRVVRSIAQTRPGTRLLTSVADGSIASEVTGTDMASSQSRLQSPGLLPLRRISRRQGERPPGQMELFDPDR